MFFRLGQTEHSRSLLNLTVFGSRIVNLYKNLITGFNSGHRKPCKIPRSMLSSSGNSSRLDERNFLPNGVKCTSSERIIPFLSFGSVIVLNLYRVNTWPFSPGRSYLKITGLPIFTLTKITIINIIGDKTTNASNVQRKSCGYFIYFL